MTKFATYSGKIDADTVHPTDPQVGQEYYNSNTNKWYIYTASGWRSLSFAPYTTTSTSTSTTTSTSTSTSTSTTTTTTSTSTTTTTTSTSTTTTTTSTSTTI